MKYLNDTFKINGAYPTGNRPAAAGMYRYEVARVDDHAQSEDENSTLFSGNYYASSIYRYDFDITEIIRNRGAWKMTPTGQYGDPTSLIETYYMRIWYDSTNYFTTTEFDVARIYPYPNLGGWSDYTYPSGTFFDLSNATSASTSVCAQGFSKNNKTWRLIPTYPLLENEQDMENSSMQFGVAIEFGGALRDTFNLVAYYAGDNPLDDPISWCSLGYINYDGAVNAWLNNVGYVVGHYGRPTTDIYVALLNNDNDTWYNVAKFELCHTRYYLQWQDRFGSYQSQPFTGKMQYSENITNNEKQNYNNVRSKRNVVIQPKWEIYSGWIKESLFPIYESIYVSPTVRLYDAQTDRTYDVIINDNYVEKKYSKEKTMLNINLTLEATEKQNILY